VLSGTPTQSGTFPIVVTAKDSNACTGSVSDSFTIAASVVSTAPAATLSPTSLNFGEVISGATSPPSAITLSNTGNAALDLTGSGISISGANAAEFSQSNGCGSSVAAGASCTIDVTFTPGLTAGSETATLSVSNNAAGSPQQAALAAVILPPASVSCTIPTINVTADSGTAQITCTATDFIGTISLDCNLPASLSAYVTCSFSPNSLVFTSSVDQATTTLSIAPVMTGSVQRQGAPGGTSAGAISLAALLWLPILSLGFRPNMGKSQRRMLLLLILFCGLQLVTACHSDSGGGNGTSTAPPGTYQASVVLTGPGLNSTTLTFSIQVQ
jgi:trimeric autotransporter adhesin